MIYNQGAARRFLLNQPSTNPTIAGRYLLGEKRTRAAERKLTRGRRRTGKRYNPAPALASLLGGVLKLPKFLKQPSEKRAAAVAPSLVQSAVQGNLTAVRAIRERSTFGIAKERAVWAGALAQIPPALLELERKHAAQIPGIDHKGPETAAQTAAARPFMAPAAAAAPVAGATIGGLPVSVAGQLAVPIVRELAKPAKKPRRQRYPSYVDRDGRQRYSYKPPGSDIKIPTGASPTPGSPYSFFRGAVGKGGAAATAGQVALAGAAGIGAYLVTSKLLQYLGGGAQRKEEAGVNAALALREARAELAQQLGRQPTAAELRPMNDAYRAKLIELGYDPVTFTRTRSGIENFLEDYNPFGG